jgi:hypothetical protein
VLLPTDKASSLVSVADLQELLQGLEERITQRLSPLQRPLQPSKESVAFVSASELQSTLQTLEQRLTRRVEQMLVHNGIAVPMAPVANQTVPQAQSPMVATAPPVAVARASYALLLVNLLLFLFGVALLWRWWQHLSADERRTKLATWRAHVARQSARIPRFGSRSHR